MASRIIATLVITTLAALSQAQVGTYNETYQSGQDPQLVLGHPVPEPVESTLAGDYFRSYDSLRTRLSDLAITYSIISETNIGTSLDGRTIYGYTLSDTNNIGVGGTRESGIMINGTIHAREWASPETLVQIIEKLASEYGSDPIVTYLVDQNRIVLVPVSNIDGFLQAQRYHNKFWYQGSREWDGRMKRKNMRDSDEDIATSADHDRGVDVNRNFSFGWINGASSTTAETYRGSAPFSESESQAITSAVSLFESAAQIRCYLDIHGAIPLIYYTQINNANVDQQTATLMQRMQSTYRAINGVPSSYLGFALSPDAALGASDEYFANTYKIPGFTIEYPTPNYRDTKFSPNDFITPNDEVAEIVEENTQALLLAMLFASGPPIIERITIWEDADNQSDIDPSEVYYSSEWIPDGSPAITRSQNTTTAVPLIYGHAYNVLIEFSKPMRRNGSQWPGQTFPTQPAVLVALHDGSATQTISASPIANGWLSTAATANIPGYRRYADDAWLGTLDLTAVSSPSSQSAPITIETQDLYGFALDAKPTTPVDWNEGWTGFENAEGIGNQGGPDQSFNLSFSPATSVVDWKHIN